jgi:hypothetical protein
MQEKFKPVKLHVYGNYVVIVAKHGQLAKAASVTPISGEIETIMPPPRTS